MVLKNNLHNITLIMENDPNLKGIVFNQLADGLEIKGEVPWKHPARFWRDADDAQLISFVDSHYYEVYSLQRTEEVPEDYKEISFVCLRADGAYEAPSTVGIMCRAAKKKVKGLEDFHFHTLRHTYTSNLLSGGAKPKDVQELLGHSDVSTTMNIYAHSTREAKRTSARLLDKVVGGE